MNTKCMLGCVSLLLAFGLQASGQLVAGSPEDQLFTEIASAADPDQKIALIRQFEEQFPQAPDAVFVSLYNTAMNVFAQKGETGRIREYGEKILERDPENVSALMTLSRSLAVARQDLPDALEYAERAVSAVERMKTQSPPEQFTQEQWDQYVASTETSARGILAYARSVGPQ